MGNKINGSINQIEVEQGLNSKFESQMRSFCELSSRNSLDNEMLLRQLTIYIGFSIRLIFSESLIRGFGILIWNIFKFYNLPKVTKWYPYEIWSYPMVRTISKLDYLWSSPSSHFRSWLISFWKPWHLIFSNIL